MTLCQPIEAVLAMGTMEVDPVRVRSAMMSTGNGDTITEEDVQAAVNVNMQRLLDGM